MSPLAGLPTVTVAFCGIGAPPWAWIVNSNFWSAFHSMPSTRLVSVKSVGTPVAGTAEYVFTNLPSVTFAVASSWPCPLSVTVTVMRAVW